jgi:hypothetical protein
MKRRSYLEKSRYYYTSSKDFKTIIYLFPDSHRFGLTI